ncbi:hypothetical protein PF005_g5911 [Phytophthora fragariae]|uniref:Uncharacterized protein n=2 Tax=Phytophthora TaxID=4783 RepID=A0A6A3SYY2_9STRA|nr:hypothetical protein PF003_g19377 [Phytophthora fragariae]KAE9036028.1 hypothetical protein PR002_g7280 [Phytophthora rubi]KAE8944203.1 hypothetical protein PF009_g6114 [Phytophthora fragariae]KAE9021581.1 hypothetical protein PF011_g4877 [Phytophthora fragariae]KAE9041083.1 hypothetical protein PR001_g6778 [Phytophthora rubi]
MRGCHNAADELVGFDRKAGKGSQVVYTEPLKVST